ncbi:MAG: hypothetical protein IK115_04925 [Lachnospiraceae bacterium]|nr:hypothetical protein [Lachnospiraceae bacterium]
MTHSLRNNYFIIIRMILMISLCVYAGGSVSEEAEVSVWMLLLTLLYISAVAVKELFEGKAKLVTYIAAFVLWGILMAYGGRAFVLPGVFLGMEVFLELRVRYYMYFFFYLVVLTPGAGDKTVLFILITMLLSLYIQHEFVVLPYREQMYAETVTQQGLKRDIKQKESEAKEEHKKSMLMAENKILEERAALSQTLHDKLGHNINGSVYQLEASKLLMEKDPEKARAMIQAVIDRLRTGMDEIRAILRKERPEKKKLALLQLHELCDDCIRKGVEAELVSEGDLSGISDELWEVMLDNIFEAVTNSLKYSGCRHIDIRIAVLNRMVRCTVKDDGAGCAVIVDGMGISGMRKRVREAGGIIDFSSADMEQLNVEDMDAERLGGFTVNMLLPVKRD